MAVFFVILIAVMFLFLLYSLYQLERNNEVFKIRKNWIYTDDDRWDKYSYDYMVEPNKHNWYGLRYPKDNHYPQ